MPSSKPVFRIGNKHGASSGEPPQIDGDTKGRYHGYFENEYGEQAIFVYDYPSQTAQLLMGDNGWDNTISVIDGEARDVMLNEAERAWLRACWLAATER